MDITIRETLKGLELALEARNGKIAEVEAKDDTVLIEEKKAELQKEFDEKLKAFVDGINEEKEKALGKLQRDVETINELIGEYNEKLAGILAQATEEVTEEVAGDGVGADCGEVVEEQNNGEVVEQQETLIVENTNKTPLASFLHP